MHPCPVCGCPKLQEPPHSASGGGSYEICPSCGFQFGVDDDDKGITFEQAREKWIEGGMKWHSKGLAQPKDWNPASPAKTSPRPQPKRKAKPVKKQAKAPAKPKLKSKTIKRPRSALKAKSKKKRK